MTGMMGAVNQLLAKISKKLKYNFIDVDKLIEKKEALSINNFLKKVKFILEKLKAKLS